MRVDCKLSEAETKRLEELEDRVEKAWHEAGLALLAIREERLYRQHYDTFEEFCRERHQLGKAQINFLIGAATVYQNLEAAAATPGSRLTSLPCNAKQVRSMAGLSAEDQIAVWKDALNESGGAQPPTKVVEKKAKAKKAAAKNPPPAPPPAAPRRDLTEYQSDQGLKDRIADHKKAEKAMREAQEVLDELERSGKLAAAAKRLAVDVGVAEAAPMAASFIRIVGNARKAIEAKLKARASA